MGRKDFFVLSKIFKKVAPKVGAKILVEPEWGMAGQITLKDGRRFYFKYNHLDINPIGSFNIAKDKGYANFFMKKLGYPTVPRSKTFFSPEWGKAIGHPKRNIDSAYLYAKKIGFPVIVKPNSGSQGAGISLVYNKKEFYQSVKQIFKNDRIVLVQKFLKGQDYRLVVLDNKMVVTYERLALNVVGDGKSNIRELLKKKEDSFIKKGRDIEINIKDPRIKNKLAHQNLDFKSILKKGVRVYLLDNANLSTGGGGVDVTDEVHPKFRKLAIQLTRDMGLRFCGVDLIVDGSIEDKPDKYWVLEINASPGLDHYSKIGKKQAKIVENLYLEILKSL